MTSGASATKTVRSVLPIIRQRLTAAGVDSVSAEADWMLCDLLDAARSDLYTNPERIVDASLLGRLEDMIDRRERREPLQYILGKTEFYALEFDLVPGVLIPRPETEIVVEKALGCLTPARPCDVLDVGTGSGAIAVSLAVHRPLARVWAIDLSPLPLTIARRNASRHGVNPRWLRADLAALPAQPACFDLVVSNPPYVADADVAQLAPEIRCFEPRLALAAGLEGLDAYASMGPEVHRILKPGGHLVLELPGVRTERVQETLRTHFPDSECFDDLAGRPRVLVARKPT